VSLIGLGKRQVDSAHTRTVKSKEVSLQCGGQMPWNPFSRKGEGDQFETLLKEACARLGIRLQELSADQATILKDGSPSSLYLANIKPRVLSAPVQHRPAILDDFLQSWQTAPSDQGHTLAEVRDRLMPRIGLPFAGLALPEEEVPPSRPFIQGRAEEQKTTRDAAQGTVVIPEVPPLETNVVVDEPRTVWYVRQKHLTEWNVDFDALLPIAIENLRRRSSPNPLIRVDQMPETLACETGDSYDAARLLIIKDLVVPWPREGVIAVVPNRDLLLCVRLDSLDSIRAMKPMFAFAQRQSTAMGYPITGHALWFDGTVWEYIPSRLEGKGVGVFAPDRFVQALDRLGKSGSNGDSL